MVSELFQTKFVQHLPSTYRYVMLVFLLQRRLSGNRTFAADIEEGSVNWLEQIIESSCMTRFAGRYKRCNLLTVHVILCVRNEVCIVEEPPTRYACLLIFLLVLFFGQVASLGPSLPALACNGQLVISG
ncbi:expressed unknown protein [Seminavis robusta]|uniref:Uncharacterized protein n=1 Tax=Seminavis robusta TaxID=568900 RepID=A0A9N8DXI4_9STRA|nr:expressed unknown protein [Seminavis robusta]|eukprot:Sro442_g143811.1  (129) ;mRNA; f:8053-8439